MVTSTRASVGGCREGGLTWGKRVGYAIRVQGVFYSLYFFGFLCGCEKYSRVKLFFTPKKS